MIIAIDEKGENDRQVKEIDRRQSFFFAIFTRSSIARSCSIFDHLLYFFFSVPVYFKIKYLTLGAIKLFYVVLFHR